MIASGEFTVALNPQTDGDFNAGRLTIDKSYTGDMVGRGRGQMLSHRSSVEGSAGYVAIETVSAALAGKQGSFVLQHSGVMNRGAQSLTIDIVPDSGTDGLTGISGSLDIRIEDGHHFYTLNYELV